jgi:Ribbon-helix-helix protein, copG family.
MKIGNRNRTWKPVNETVHMARDEGISVSELVRRIVEAYVSKSSEISNQEAIDNLKELNEKFDGLSKIVAELISEIASLKERVSSLEARISK